MRSMGATKSRKETHARICLAGALGIAYACLLHGLSGPPTALKETMAGASRLMARATSALRDCRESRGLPVDPASDPNRTGLIGAERSPITTSLGSLEAKRTTTNPDFAALVVSLFHEAGVRRGDAVAVGASSSFPALIVATLSAAEAMGIEPLIISSLGASEYGANLPGFHWIDMEDCLRAAGVLDVRPVARAVGGEGDVGLDMSAEGRGLLVSRIRDGAVPFLEEPDLERNVSARMALYKAGAGTKPIKAFVNIGGSSANIGRDAAVLKLKPGLCRGLFVPPPAARGVIQAMAAAGVPVIHLLNIKGLCERYGLPWDPRPLPEPGSGGMKTLTAGAGRVRIPLSAGYILATVVILVPVRRRPRQTPRGPDGPNEFGGNGPVSP
jgi:poly-gamma-glutamate system protein